MTWRYQPEAMPNGLTATPREVNAITRAYADELSGHIDRDNITNKVVTGAKFVANAIRRIASYPEPADSPATVNLTIPRYSSQTGWTLLTEVTLDTTDSWVDIDANAFGLATAGTQRAALQIAIGIDDAIIAESPPEACHYNDGFGVVEAQAAPLAVSVAAPVQAGAHRIQLYANLRADTKILGSRSNTTVAISGYWICAVEHRA